MAYIADTVFDNGLSTAATNGDTLSITSTTGGDPGGTYATVTTNSLADETVTPTGPTDGAVNGRRIYVPAITNGTITNNGTAGYWALTDGTSVVYASGALSTTQVVSSGNSFTLTQVNITIADAS